MSPETGRLAAAAALAAALVAALLAGATALATLLGLAGLATTAAGLWRGRRALVTVGSGGLFAAVLVAGGASDRPGLTLAAGAAATCAWTVAQTAVDVRATLPGAPTRELEVAHVAGTTALVGGGAVVAYAAYAVGLAAPPLAVALALVAAVALTVAVAGDAGGGPV